MATFLIYWLVASIIFTLGYCLGHKIGYRGRLSWTLKLMEKEYAKYRNESS